jgi:hypothetical protein
VPGRIGARQEVAGLRIVGEGRTWARRYDAGRLLGLPLRFPEFYTQALDKRYRIWTTNSR